MNYALEVKKERQKLRKMETGKIKIYHTGDLGEAFFTGDNIIRDAVMQEYLGGFGIMFQQTEESKSGLRRHQYIYKRVYKPDNGRYDLKPVLKEVQ